MTFGSGFRVAIGLLAGALGTACAHPLIITSDPPGEPVRFNGRLVGETPVVVIEDEPYAMHTVEVGEGRAAVTTVVPANRLFSRDALSAGLMPLSCTCLLPALATAGTDDRVHIARSYSGEDPGEVPGTPVELGYLPPGRGYPANTQVAPVAVDGRLLRVMVDRRPLAFTLQYLGLSYPAEPLVIEPEGAPSREVSRPLRGVGLEEEFTFHPRLGIGAGFSFRELHPQTTVAGGVRQLNYAEVRTGLLFRYRQPLLHFDGVAGGLDLPLALGGDAVFRTYRRDAYRSGGRTVEALTERSTTLRPWVEAGLDAQITRPVVLYGAARYYPLEAPAPDGPWGNLGVPAELAVSFGMRILH